MQLRIRELRKANNITMKQLGAALGFSEVTISQYETVKRQPNPEALIKFASYFGVSVNCILGAESDADQPDPSQSSADPVRQAAMDLFDTIPEDRRAAALEYLRFLAQK